MKRTVPYAIALSGLCIIVSVVYARLILPIVIAYPFRHDFAQDYLGARALLNRADELYPVLAPAFEQLGLDWGAFHRSTHLPTAFLLAVPFALLHYRSSLILWMIAMFACIVLAARALGLAWKKSILAGALSLAWPPTFWSLFQYTPIWLLCLVLAYRFRRHPLVSGVYIGLASLPKYLAAPALLYHLWRRQWSALIGFGTLWLVALALLLLLRPDAVAAYLSSNIGNSLDQIHRPDNGALVVVAWRLGGWLGLAAAALLILWVFWSGLRREDPAGWACFVWLGIALLPIAWVYSLLPLLPWLVLALRAPGTSSRIFAGAALLVPYAAAAPTRNPGLVALSIALSGIAFAVASERKTQSMATSRGTCTWPTG